MEVMEEGTVEAEKAVEKVVVAMVVGRAAAGMVAGMVEAKEGTVAVATGAAMEVVMGR